MVKNKIILLWYLVYIMSQKKKIIPYRYVQKKNR